MLLYAFLSRYIFFLLLILLVESIDAKNILYFPLAITCTVSYLVSWNIQEKTTPHIFGHNLIKGKTKIGRSIWIDLSTVNGTNFKVLWNLYY